MTRDSILLLSVSLAIAAGCAAPPSPRERGALPFAEFTLRLDS